MSAKTSPSDDNSARRVSPTPFLVVGAVLVVAGVALALLAPLETVVSCTRGSAPLTCGVSEENRVGTRDHGSTRSDDWATEGDPASGLILRAGERALRLPFEPAEAERFATEFKAFTDGDAPSFRFVYKEPEGASVVFGLTTLIGIILLGIGALMRTSPGAFAKREKKARATS